MKVKITYPSHLQEIPLSAYQKWLKVEQNTNDEELLAYKFVQIFTGIDLKTINKMAVKDVNFLILEIKKVLEQKPQFHKRWKFNGVEFGFIPDMQKISWGEYIDAEMGLKDFDNLHKAMAVLFRPITKTHKDTYEIEEYTGDERYHEIMKLCPLNIVLGTSFFFFNSERELLSNTTKFLKEETKKLTKMTSRKRRNFKELGDGIIQFTEYLEKESKTLTPLQSYPFIKPLPFLRISSKRKESSITNTNAN